MVDQSRQQSVASSASASAADLSLSAYRRKFLKAMVDTIIFSKSVNGHLLRPADNHRHKGALLRPEDRYSQKRRKGCAGERVGAKLLHASMLRKTREANGSLTE